MIDVGAVVASADFSETLCVLSRSETINDYGETILTESQRTITAAVQPASGRDLMRLPEAVRVHDVIKVYTKDHLSVQTAGGYSDIVIFKDVRYQVIRIDADYSQNGFIRAFASRESVSNG